MTGLATTASTPLVTDHRRTIGWWLMGLCGMVLIMVVLGGVTRLTDSGLSMVDWRPVTGWLPPLNAAEWQAVFELYTVTPEYQKINAGMDVDGFKSIFWLEYLHRLWGRIIGVAFFAPFAWFLVKGRLGGGLASKLLLMFVLGGAQGVLGWFMVKSGLVDRPDVSQYRLTAHLGLAILIYAYMFWVALGLLSDKASLAVSAGLRNLAAFSVLWILLTMLAGGFVAGLDAGLTYNTFPLMNGKVIPDGLFSQSPLILNFFENVTTVQFDHRMMAYGTILLVGLTWWRARKEGLTGKALIPFHHLLGLMVLQVVLGIGTLLLAVPVLLAALHQLMAFLLLTTGLWSLHRVRKTQ